MNFDEFCKMIKSLDENITIGIHGISTARKEENNHLSLDDIGNKIMHEGLKLYDWGGALGSVLMFGQVKDLTQNDLEQLYNYMWDSNNEKIINILFGFPEIITNSDGKDFYLGHFPKSDYTHVKGEKEAGDRLPLNVLFNHTHLIPIDFIIGCIKTTRSSYEIEFINNDKFYKFNEFQEFYDNLFLSLKQKKILNIIDFYNNLDLLSRFKIDYDLILKQYEEYLLQINNKTK